MADKAREKFRELMSRLKVVKENWEKSGNGHDCCMILEPSCRERTDENTGNDGTVDISLLGPDDIIDYNDDTIKTEIEDAPTKPGCRVSFLQYHNPAVM